uniref:Uncharacterized protein n=1 Tax=Hyaloperonospora arabidopsidis (strain Emoy2) TaxID=559515 RepID=M4BTZ4_HYAAE
MCNLVRLVDTLCTYIDYPSFTCEPGDNRRIRKIVVTTSRDVVNPERRLICLARLFGHHGGHFAKDRALKSQETPGTRPITPDGPLTHLDEADLDHILGKFASLGSGVKLGGRADNSKAEVE